MLCTNTGASPARIVHSGTCIPTQPVAGMPGIAIGHAALFSDRLSPDAAELGPSLIMKIDSAASR